MNDIEWPIFLLEGESLVISITDLDQLSDLVEENDIYFQSYRGGWDRRGRRLSLAWAYNRPHVELKDPTPDMGALLHAITRYAVHGSGGRPFQLLDDVDPTTALHLADEHVRGHTPPTWLERLIARLRRGRSRDGESDRVQQDEIKLLLQGAKAQVVDHWSSKRFSELTEMDSAEFGYEGWLGDFRYWVEVDKLEQGDDWVHLYIHISSEGYKKTKRLKGFSLFVHSDGSVRVAK